MVGGQLGSKTFWSNFEVLNDISGGQTIIPLCRNLEHYSTLKDISNGARKTSNEVHSKFMPLVS